MKILSYRRFALWWQLAMDWFQRQFAAIAASIDFTPVEEKLDDVKSDVADVKTAVENIDIELGTSSDTSVSTTIFGWLKSIRDFLVGIVTTNPYAKEASVKDGNDTAISVSKSVYGALMDNTNGLSAIKSVVNAIPTTPPATATDVSNAQSAIIAAIPNVAGLATELNATSNKNEVLAAIAANAGIPTMTIPDSTAAQELAPSVLYIFATRTSTLTLTLGTPIVGIANEYHFFVVCGSTAPTVNFPSGITWNGGSAPTIAADKTYEVSILNNVAAYFEV